MDDYVWRPIVLTSVCVDCGRLTTIACSSCKDWLCKSCGEKHDDHVCNRCDELRRGGKED
jgi:hypothetical protein